MTYDSVLQACAPGNPSQAFVLQQLQIPGLDAEQCSRNFIAAQSAALQANHLAGAPAGVAGLQEGTAGTQEAGGVQQLDPNTDALEWAEQAITDRMTQAKIPRRQAARQIMSENPGLMDRCRQSGQALHDDESRAHRRRVSNAGGLISGDFKPEQ